MDRADSQTGIIGGGVIAEDPRCGDLERRIAERSERLYRLRLIQRFLLAWACPGNLVLVALTSATLLFGPVSWAVDAVCVLGTVASIAVSARFLYLHHFRVRTMTSELRELQRAQRENQLDESADDLFGMQQRYRVQLPPVIEDYRLAARRHRWKNHTLQCVVIVGSICTASATAASAAASPDRVPFVDPRWAAVLVSLLVAISAALSAYAKYQQRAARLQRTADNLEREYESVQLRVGRYRKFGDDRAAYAEFTDVVEELRTERVPGCES